MQNTFYSHHQRTVTDIYISRFLTHIVHLSNLFLATFSSHIASPSIPTPAYTHRSTHHVYAMSDSYCLIRNATAIFEYGGKKFLIDPMLAAKGAYPGFEHSANSELRNPLVDLPMPVEDILNGIDAILLTHTHADHWDDAAVELIPKTLLIYTQHGGDAALLKSQGFTNVRVMEDGVTDLGSGVTLRKARCQHGPDNLYAIPQMAELLGQVAGLVFQRPGGKTVYFVGDTVWFKGVEDAMKTYKPDFVVLNAGSATLDHFGPIIMGEDDVTRTLDLVPDAVVVAQHMEAVNHCVLSRQQLREFVEKKGVASKVFIPADGEYVPISV